MKSDNQIDYVEFPMTEPAPTRLFYETAFGWKFEDYGPNYTSFSDGRLAGGFTSHDGQLRQPLVVIFAGDLEAAREKVLAAGGRLTKDIFSFPGGRRFQFADPAGNELAVWTDRD